MKKGFTLLEAMVVLLISTVIIAALFMTMTSGRSSWSTADTEISLQQDLRKAIVTMGQELRDSGNAHISCLANGTPQSSISFNVSQGVDGTGNMIWSTIPVNYSVISGQLVRTENGNSEILANNITSLAFVRTASAVNIVRINLTAQRTTQFSRLINASSNTAVMLRN